MAKRLCLLAVGAILAFVAASSLSCSYFSVPVILETHAQQVTLSEASEIVGLPIPVPTYLPDGYTVREVYSYNKAVILLISDKDIEKNLVTHTDAAGTRQRYEFRCPMMMKIDWYATRPPEEKIPGKRVTINGREGVLSGGLSGNTLNWTWAPVRHPTGVFQLVLSAGKRVSDNELIKVAESARY